MKLKPFFYLACILLLVLHGCKKESGNNTIPKGATDTTNTKVPDTKVPDTTPAPDKTISISNFLQNNMVIQRDKPFVISGKATAGYKVTVKVTWSANDFVTTADQYSNWSITIPAAPANANPQTITCTADALPPVVLSNILIGDVWACSGQSNMVMQVDAITPFTGVTDYANEIAAANYPLIRVQTIQQDGKGSPQYNFGYTNTWEVCSPATVGKFSGVAYFFAQKLFKSLNVPVGIVVSAINGSGCRDWSDGGYAYNGMISPLTNLAVKGFIWYQGENDSHISPASIYTDLNVALINQWRTNFRQGTLPFYYVQMTPFAEDYYNTAPFGGDLVSNYYAKFREAQSNIRATANTGMAVTMDVGEVPNHHPRNKKPVGERLALLALKNTYNLNVECIGPQYLSWAQAGNTVVITYVNGTANGLSTIDNKPLNQHFYVAGADHVFHQVNATINGNSVFISTSINVQAIRYAFTNAPITNLQNSAGLPAEPFRTDNWDN